MKWRLWAVCLILLWNLSPAFAFSHGLNTAWPNSFGGVGVCFGPAVTGCSQGFDAQCAGGVTADATARDNFVAFGIAQGATLVNLYIPPGSHCSVNFLTWDGTTGGPAIQNSVIWGYGATLITPGGYITARDFYEDAIHEAFIVSANAGDGSVTLVTAVDASIFSVGDWIAITGLELQTCCGFPPNFQFYEYRQITSITGTTTKVIALSAPLTNSYLSTWPSIQSDGSMGNNGPAKIFKMQPNWNQNTSLYGLTINVTTFPSSQDQLHGRNVQVYDMTSKAENTSFSVNQAAVLARSFVNSMEMDKAIESLQLSYVKITGDLTFQSATPKNFLMENSSASFLNGTPFNGTFNRVTLAAFHVGPWGYGHGNSIIFNNSTIPTAQISNHAFTAADLAYNGSGTFSIAVGAAAAPNFLAVAIPNQKYAFADSDGTLNCVNTPQSACTFKITAVRGDGVHYFADTDIPGALPTPTCNTHSCPIYVAYPAATITQTNSGPADITQFAAPP